MHQGILCLLEGVEVGRSSRNDALLIFLCSRALHDDAVTVRFAGVVKEGFVWGRGSIDLKNMVRMCFKMYTGPPT